jgi:glycine cleavage system H lipoate-binding protein
MKELTAVQWLVEKYAIVMGLGSTQLMKDHIEQAKVMEEKQRKDAMDQGYDFATSEAVKEIQKNYQK